MNAEFPAKLSFLFEPWRYKIAYGGRGGSKSWGYARALSIIGSQYKKRILCARETQKSITDSVYKLLADQIQALGLGGNYSVLKKSIEGYNGTEIFFAGLKHNINNIKSVEACDIVWVEEAQSVSKASWEVLIPTIRKAGSEIWASFNPELETDDTYQRFVLNAPPNAKVVKLCWWDNPWFPDVLRIEAEHLKEKDPRAYLHVWEGECKSAVEGAIYAEEIQSAELAGRITQVSYDRSRPVHTYWDLGYGDLNAIWFGQQLANGDHRFIDYLENKAKPLEWYVIQMQAKGYMYGTDWLPWDGVDAMLHSRLSGDKSKSIEMQLRHTGRKVRIAPKLNVSTGINAARTIFSRCWFDAEKCADGLQALRHYQWGPPSTLGVDRREPLHNWASHGADAFRTFSVAAKSPEREIHEPPRERPRILSPWS